MSVCVCVVNIFNPRHPFYCSCAVCVCQCFKSYLASRASVCSENTVTYSVVNVGQKFVFSLKLLCSRAMALQCMATVKSAILSLGILE